VTSVLCMQGLIESCQNESLASEDFIRLVSLFDNEEASRRQLSRWCVTFSTINSVI